MSELRFPPPDEGDSVNRRGPWGSKREATPTALEEFEALLMTLVVEGEAEFYGIDPDGCPLFGMHSPNDFWIRANEHGLIDGMARFDEQVAAFNRLHRHAPSRDRGMRMR